MNIPKSLAICSLVSVSSLAFAQSGSPELHTRVRSEGATFSLFFGVRLSPGTCSAVLLGDSIRGKLTNSPSLSYKFSSSRSGATLLNALTLPKLRKGSSPLYFRVKINCRGRELSTNIARLAVPTTEDGGMAPTVWLREVRKKLFVRRPAAPSTPTPNIVPTVVPTIPPKIAPSPTGGDRDNLILSFGTYFGGVSDDRARSVALGKDNFIIVGATTSHAPSGVISHALVEGAGDGALLRFSSTGTLSSITTLADTIGDVATREDGSITAGGSKGVYAISDDGSKLNWRAQPGVVEKVAVGQDGTVAAVVGSKIFLYSSTGALLASWVGGANIGDVAVDSARALVYATGFTQKNVSGYCSGQLQVAWIKAFGFDGKLAWKSYDWTPQQVAPSGSGLCADTRGLSVALGRDGMVYFGGESAGGNSIFSKSSQALSSNAPNVAYDAFTTPYSTASNHISYLARIDPLSGEVLSGQIILARLTSGKGNTIRLTSIEADEGGQVYATGTAAYAIGGRELQKINGESLGTYGGGEAYLLTLSSDMKKRRHWTAFTKSGTSTGGAIAVKNGVVALAATLDSGTLITKAPIQSQPAGGKDLYVASWAQSADQ